MARAGVCGQREREDGKMPVPTLPARQQEPRAAPLPALLRQRSRRWSPSEVTCWWSPRLAGAHPSLPDPRLPADGMAPSYLGERFPPVQSPDGEHARTLPRAWGAPRYLASLAWGRASESAWLVWW